MQNTAAVTNLALKDIFIIPFASVRPELKAGGVFRRYTITRFQFTCCRKYPGSASSATYPFPELPQKPSSSFLIT